jgi:hypothetical protein
MDLMLGEDAAGGGGRPPHLTNLAQVRTRLLADGVPPPPPPSFSSNIYSANSTHSGDSNENDYGGDGGNQQSLPSYDSPAHGGGVPEPNILQVYAAYETGLAQGTSVRIKVTTATTAREVVDLVIKQLNMAVILKGKDRPIYENEKLANFCLVAVIGNREGDATIFHLEIKCPILQVLLPKIPIYGGLSSAMLSSWVAPESRRLLGHVFS